MGWWHLTSGFGRRRYAKRWVRRTPAVSAPVSLPDWQGAFYPLEGSGALLGLPDLGAAVDRLIEDVLHHVGHALQDDAAILLIGRWQLA